MRADQKRYLKLTPLARALQALLEEASPVGVRRVSVLEALDHFSAREYSAKWDVPKSDVSAMDGYALRAADLACSGPARTFKVVGSSVAGGRLRVGPGEAYYVSTGAPIPRGADTVVRVEETRYVDEHTISVGVCHPPGKNVSRRGEDLKRGELVVAAGGLVSPAVVGVLAYFGVRRVKVYARPRVGVLSVGDELVDFAGHRKPAAGECYNNNAWLIRCYLRRLGFEPEYFGVVGDDEGEVRARVLRALRRVDVLVTLGGTSVGLRDTTPDAVGSIPGSRFLFHGLRAVPIKPVGAAVVEGGGRKRFVVLLPGHVVSAALGFHTVCVPLLVRLSGGMADALSLRVPATLDSPLENSRNLEALYLVALKRSGCELSAEPLGWGSNLMGHLLKASGFVRVGAGERLEAGTRVFVEVLGARPGGPA